MATSIALAVVTAAITACGGGAADTPEAVGATSTGTSSSATAVDAPASGVEITTNVNAITETDSASSASAAGNAAASVGETTMVASADPVTASGSTVVAESATPPTEAAPLVNSAPIAVGTATAVARPAGNTGTGFFVANGKLYDAKGKEFRIRGVNRAHYDNPGAPTGIPRSGANAERIVIYFSRTPSTNMSLVSSQMLANKVVPIPSNWGGTCKSDPASLAAIVDTWVAQAPTWTQLNSNGLINIANEWGPGNSTVWRDSYITAIQRMRAAGYTGTLVVDAGGCGQSAGDLINYGAAVLAADPQKNILFDLHVYGGFYAPATASWQADYTKTMAQLKATGLPVVIGEFGPGRNIGPSPTMIKPETIVATAEANGWGWIAWAWDDNDLNACQADDNWFSMTVNCGKYTGQASELTTFGKTIVPIMQQTAVKASIFN